MLATVILATTATNTANAAGTLKIFLGTDVISQSTLAWNAGSYTLNFGIGSTVTVNKFFANPVIQICNTNPAYTDGFYVRKV